jgi:hypothetical protein
LIRSLGFQFFRTVSGFDIAEKDACYCSEVIRVDKLTLPPLFVASVLMEATRVTTACARCLRAAPPSFHALRKSAHHKNHELFR